MVAGFSSGELNAYRYENGRLVWQDALSRARASDQRFVIGHRREPGDRRRPGLRPGPGRRTVALELISGQRIWELNIAGISTPWVAGDWLFTATDDGKLLAIAKTTGKIRWINQLPEFERQKSKRGQITYLGPILAGGRLIVVGSNGTLINFDPATGNYQSQTRLGARITLPPVVANSTLYVLDNDGQLHALPLVSAEVFAPRIDRTVRLGRAHACL